MASVENAVSGLYATLTRHLSSVRYEDIPPETQRLGRLILADIAGCMVSGWKNRAAGTVARLVGAQGGAGQSTLWGQGIKIPAGQAAFAGGVGARAFEFGVVDCNAPGAQLKPLHSAETLVPVALAMAERCEASGKELLTAFLLGEDLAARLTACLEFSQPLDCRGTVNTLCAAVVAGRLLRFHPEQYMAALGLSLHLLNGVRQGIHYSLGQGLSAQTGILAAELAHHGLLGVADPSQELGRILTALGGTFDPAPLTADLGRVFYSSSTFKPYPCCRAVHGAVECGLDLLRQGLTLDNLERVQLCVSPWAGKHLVARPFAIRQEPHGDAAYSLEYTLAGVLLRGCCALDGYTEEAIADPAIPAVIRHISLTTEGWPLHPDDIFLSTAAVAHTRDGRELRAHVRIPRGNECMGDPLTLDEKKNKFMANMVFGGMEPGRAEKAWALSMELAELDAIDVLSAAFRIH